MAMEEAECGCIIENGAFHFMCDQHATPTVKRVVAHAHTAGRREAWEKMRHACEWLRSEHGNWCRLNDEKNAHCRYDTCPLLKDKDGEG